MRSGLSSSFAYLSKSSCEWISMCSPDPLSRYSMLHVVLGIFILLLILSSSVAIFKGLGHVISNSEFSSEVI